MTENTKNTNIENNIINEEEFAVAEKEAAERVGVNAYTHTFAKPFSFEEKTFKSLTFDWDKLCGRDYLSIEAEMATVGKIIITPEFSGEFIVRMIAKACTDNIGSDTVEAMPLKDFNKIRKEARSFLMNSAL